MVGGVVLAQIVQLTVAGDLELLGEGAAWLGKVCTQENVCWGALLAT